VDQITAKLVSPDNITLERYKILLNTPPSIQQDIYIHGTENNVKFKSSLKIIKCSNISIDIEPDFIELDTDGSLNSEYLKVSFSTFDFVPSKVYVILSSLPDKRNFGYDEEIRDFKLIRSGRKNKLYFTYPQNGLKLSDLIDTSRITKSQSITLGVILESVDNFNVNVNNINNNENFFDNFSSTFKIIKKDDISMERLEFLGTEDINGNTSITYQNQLTSIIRIDQYSLNYDETNHITTLTFEDKNSINNFLKNKASAYFNNKYNIYQNSTLLAIDKTTLKYERFLISQSTTNTESTEIKIYGDIYNNIYNKELILTNFFPSHYVVKSQSEDETKESQIKIKGYNYNKILISNTDVLEHIYPSSKIYVEFTDNILTKYIINKQLTIDRSEIAAYIDDDTTTEISQNDDAYMVSITFFKNFLQDNNSNKFMFWNPCQIIDEIISVKNNFYIKIESNKTISKIMGYIKVGNNKANFNLDGTNQNYIFSSTSNPYVKSIQIDSTNIDSQVTKDYIYYNISVYDEENNIKRIANVI